MGDGASTLIAWNTGTSEAGSGANANRSGALTADALFHCSGVTRSNSNRNGDPSARSCMNCFDVLPFPSRNGCAWFTYANTVALVAMKSPRLIEAQSVDVAT